MERRSTSSFVMNLSPSLSRAVGLLSGTGIVLCLFASAALAIPVNGPLANMTGCQTKGQCTGNTSGASVAERYGGRLPVQNRNNDEPFSMTGNQLEAQK